MRCSPKPGGRSAARALPSLLPSAPPLQLERLPGRERILTLAPDLVCVALALQSQQADLGLPQLPSVLALARRYEVVLPLRLSHLLLSRHSCLSSSQLGLVDPDEGGSRGGIGIRLAHLPDLRGVQGFGPPFAEELQRRGPLEHLRRAFGVDQCGDVGESLAAHVAGPTQGCDVSSGAPHLTFG